MHQSAKAYLKSIKKLFPKNFSKCLVLDVGAADINWNFRDLFINCHYVWIDLWEAKNVDIVTNINDYNPWIEFDTIFSVEMLEHDKTWKESLLKMYSLLKKGGLLVCTCAWIARREHGTFERGPSDSPATNDYYRNLDAIDIRSALPNAHVSEWRDRADLYFYVVKD